MNIVEYPDRDLMMLDLADLMASEIRAALLSKDRASLAVPGGNTPGPVFDALCAATLDWAAVTVMLTDERRVPETSPRSNARLVRERLLTDRAAAARFLSFSVPEGGDTGPLCAAIEPLLPLDVLLLGMGADMHTASLFPGAPEIADALAPDAPPVVTTTPPDGLEPRITLSGRVLRQAMSIHLVITGAEKRAALEQASHLSDTTRAPVRLILKDATIHWAE